MADVAIEAVVELLKAQAPKKLVECAWLGLSGVLEFDSARLAILINTCKMPMEVIEAIGEEKLVRCVDAVMSELTPCGFVNMSTLTAMYPNIDDAVYQQAFDHIGWMEEDGNYFNMAQAMWDKERSGVTVEWGMQEMISQIVARYSLLPEKVKEFCDVYSKQLGIAVDVAIVTISSAAVCVDGGVLTAPAVASAAGRLKGTFDIDLGCFELAAIEERFSLDSARTQIGEWCSQPQSLFESCTSRWTEFT